MSEKLFDIISKYDTINSISSNYKNICDDLNDYNCFDKIADLNEELLDKIIYKSEKIALSCRYFLENKEDYISEKQQEIKEKNLSNLPVEIDFKDKTLRIKTPLTFKRFYRDGSLKENYILMNYIKSSLIIWQKNNNFDLYRSIKSPFIILIKRKSNVYDRKKICDNDNLENGRIINEIVEALGYTDNAIQMDLISSYRYVDDVNESGMEFVIFSNEDLENHLNELKNNNLEYKK